MVGIAAKAVVAVGLSRSASALCAHAENTGRFGCAVARVSYLNLRRPACYRSARS
jgi:hypothetical protein